MNRTYYYARVSSTEQNLDRQLEAFKSMDADSRDIIGTSFLNILYAFVKTLRISMLTHLF